MYMLHQVNEIRKLCCASNWKFCPGNCNPADILSQCCSSNKLVCGGKDYHCYLVYQSCSKIYLFISLEVADANLELAKRVPVVAH